VVMALPNVAKPKVGCANVEMTLWNALLTTLIGLLGWTGWMKSWILS
jgi:hypothetical protein